MHIIGLFGTAEDFLNAVHQYLSTHLHTMLILNAARLSNFGQH